MVIKMEIWFYMLLTFCLTLLILVTLIDYQSKNKLGQIEREEGLRSHKVKKNTPIFGGVAFVLTYLVMFTFLLVIDKITFLVYLLLVYPLLSFFTLGFIDDLLILKKRKNDGLKPNIKFLFQIIISVIYFMLYLLFNFDTSIDFVLFKFDFKFMYGIFILLAFSGFTNATNLTDGIDGLLAGTLSIVLIGVYFICNDIYLKDVLAILFSGLCAFLYFNLPKAKIFMGDTGSLALGAIFVSIMIIMKLEMYLFIFGLVYIIETLSVMFQVYYFKKTNGKRLLKMAPLHHHFEIVLNSERKTLLLFYGFTIITVIIGVCLFYLR